MASGRIEAESLVENPTLIWVAPNKIAGGHFGLTATLPMGWAKVSGRLGLGGLGAKRSDSITGIGDFFPTALIDWREGDLHWNLNVSVNVPIGRRSSGV